MMVEAARSEDKFETEFSRYEVARRRFGLGRKLLGSWSGRVGLGIVLFLFAVAAVGPSVAPYDPLSVSGSNLAGPSVSHWLGTDGLGRDTFSRLLVGARLSVGSALLATVLITAIGLTVGIIAGYFGGLVDGILMRLVDMVLALPGLILALALVGLFQPGLAAVMIALVSVWWANQARIVRGLTLSIRDRPFMEAARAIGAGRLRLLVKHVLPNVVSPIIVLTTLEAGQLLLAIAGLSFLGLGVQPPTPEWGAMLNEGRAYVLTDPALILIPGLTISLAVLGLNLLGDALRDVLDPRGIDWAASQRSWTLLGRNRQRPAAATPPHLDHR